MPIKPLIKWVGGKSQLLPFLLDLFPARVRTYYEPFLGGAAVFLAMAEQGRFERAVLSDMNGALTDLYRVTRDFPALLSTYLAEMQQAYVEEPTALYSAWRRLFGSTRRGLESPLLQAALFITLNKTGFNGLYRVNQRGQYNVPWGKRPAVAMPSPDAIQAVSQALNGYVRILTADFERATADAGPGDLVYLDPPYVPLSPSSSFTSYTAGGFGQADHERVARHFRQLADQGASVVLSNNDTPWVRELYAGFEIHALPVRRSISAAADSRGPVGEVVVTSRRPVKSLPAPRP